MIEAAFDEFAARGHAGARVQDIAALIGVDKQLISYYFGGKDGLYQEVLRTGSPATPPSTTRTCRRRTTPPTTSGTPWQTRV